MAQPRSVPSCFGDRGLSTACRSRPGDAPLDHGELATIARALAHPARLAIVERFVDDRPKMTKELVLPSELAASTMSEHLRILRDAGIVVSRHEGPRVWYCICSDRLAEFGAFVEQLADTSHDASEDSGPRTLSLFVE